MTWSKKQEINIDIFDVFDEIIRRNSIKAKDWAEAAGLQNARISELRTLSMLRRNGVKEAVGRRLTLDKVEALMKSMSKLLGSVNAANEILQAAEKMSDRKDRIILYTMAAIHSDLNNASLELFLRAHLGLKGEQKKE